MSLSDMLAALMANFSAAPVGSTKKACPAATPVIHIVDDGGVPATNSATVKSNVEVSNRVTTDALPPGFLDPSDDRDNFKVEVIDSTVTGNVIPADKVLLEALHKDKTPFKPPRQINVELRRVGTTNVFRSKYIRAVVDDKDQGAVPADQTILTDWDEKRPTEEILEQYVRATYSSAKCGKVKWEARVGNANRMFVRIVVHIVRLAPGGAGVVTIDDAKKRVRKWFRRLYAQISLGTWLVNVHEVDPVENLVSISNDTGANAVGGSPITFTIHSGAGKTAKSQTITHTPAANDTPMVTANHLAAEIRKKHLFRVRTVQNPPTLEAAMIQGSADLVITDPSGARVTIDGLVAADPQQTVTVGRVNTAAFDGWFLGGHRNWVAGSIMQRTLLQAYDTGKDRVEYFVIGAHTGAGDRGQAMMPGTVYAAGKQAIDQVTMSAFLAQITMDGTDNNPFSCPHECGHTLLDAIHSTETHQMMRTGTTANNAVGATKRIFETAVPFDFPAMNIVQEPRMRTKGAGVLKPMP
jgi:hypothetical protein